jgi:hypothetical protein
VVRCAGALEAAQRHLLALQREPVVHLGLVTVTILYLLAVIIEAPGATSFLVLSGIPRPFADVAAVVVSLGLVTLAKSGFKTAFVRLRGTGTRTAGAVLLTATVIGLGVVSLGLGSLRVYELDHRRWERTTQLQGVIDSPAAGAGGPSPTADVGAAGPEPRPGTTASLAFSGSTFVVMLVGGLVLALGRDERRERSELAGVKAHWLRLRVRGGVRRMRGARYATTRASAAAVHNTAAERSNALSAIEVVAALGEEAGDLLAAAEVPPAPAPSEPPRTIGDLAAERTGIARELPGAVVPKAFPHLPGRVRDRGRGLHAVAVRHLEALRLLEDAVRTAAGGARVHHDAEERVRHFDFVTSQIVRASVVRDIRHGAWPVQVLAVGATDMPCGCDSLVAATTEEHAS